MLAFADRRDRYRLILTPRARQRIERLARASGRMETGGVLVGRYTPDGKAAEVVHVTGPCRDAKRGPRTFERGQRGLNRLLARFFRRPERLYYLGEWHTHPGGLPVPSGTDSESMVEIATDPASNCPEPVLVLAAGWAGEGLRLGAFVYPRGHAHLELAAQQP